MKNKYSYSSFRFIALTGLAILVLTVSTWGGILLSINAQRQVSFKARAIIQTLEALQINLVVAESSVRGYLITGNDQFKKDYSVTLQQVPRLLLKLQQSTREDAHQYHSIMHLSSQIAAKAAVMNRQVRLGPGISPQQNVLWGKARMEALLLTIHRLKVTEQQRIITSQQRNHQAFMMSIASVETLLVLSLILAILVWRRLRKEKKQHKKTQSQYQSLSQLHEMILHQSPIGVVVCKPIYNSNGEVDDFEFVYSNRAAREFLTPGPGVMATEKLSLRQTQLYPLLSSLVQTTLDQQSSQTLEVLTTPEQVVHLKTIIVPFNGEVLLQFDDVSRLKLTEQLLQQKAQQYQRLLDGSLTAMALVKSVRDEQGVICDFQLEYANQALYAFINHTQEEVMGTTLLQAHPYLGQGPLKRYIDCLHSGQSKTFEQYFPVRGQERWFTVGLMPAEEDTLIISLVEKTAEVQFRRQAEYIQGLLDGSVNGLISLLPQRSAQGNWTGYRLKTINQAATQMLQLSGAGDDSILTEFIARIKDAQLISNEAGEGDTAPQQRQLQVTLSGNTVWFDVRVVCRQETLIVSFTDITPLISTQKQLEDTVTRLQEANKRIKNDVFRLKQAEDEISKALDREREINAFQRRVVTLVSHEFRTPMSTILSAAEILQVLAERATDELLIKKINRYSGQISGEVLRLNKLISEVLVMEQFQTGQLRLKPVEGQLADFCQTHIRRRAAQVPAYNRVAFSAEEPDPLLWFDPVLIEHVLENLISNALKYSSGSGKPVQVTFESQPNEVSLTVYDEGIGIPAEEIARLGESFFRASNTLNTSGTGLGFSLARQLVELHGGRLHIESREGTFTRVRMYIPIAPISRTPLQEFQVVDVC